MDSVFHWLSAAWAWSSGLLDSFVAAPPIIEGKWPAVAFAVIFLLVLPVAIHLREQQIFKHSLEAGDWRRKENMPNELCAAQLFLSESDVSVQEPVAFHGRVDQVFLTTRGTLVVLDTKCRYNGKIKDSDVLQLSCYAFALRGMYDKPVEKYGYVRVVNKKHGRKKVRYVRVNLISDKNLIKKLS